MGQLDLINKHFPDGDDENPRRNKKGLPRATWMLTGAVVLFGTLLYVGYSATRGSEGDLPVVTADQSEIKSRPEDPGGMDVPHQDATIYNELNSGNQKTAEVEHLLPQPEAPMTAPQPQAQADSSAPAIVPEEPIDQVSQAPAIEQDAPQTVAETPAPSTPAATPAPKATAQNSVPAPSAPAQTKTAATAPVPATKSAPATAASKMPSGSSRVQLASVPDEQKAKAEWARISKKNADVLGGLSANFVKADIPGKGTYYRIQAGPLEQTKAQSVCSSLKSRSQPCMVVPTK